MKLNFVAALKSILGIGKPPEDYSDLPISMVLLLREPRFHTLEQLRSAAERAFKVRFSDKKDSKFFIVNGGVFTVMKVGPHILSFLNGKQPYGKGEFPPDFASSMPQESQRRAWGEHSAWNSVDYLKGGSDVELEYAVLATLCAEMIDDNCLGMYLPSFQSFAPSDGSLAHELARIAGTRHLGLT